MHAPSKVAVLLAALAATGCGSSDRVQVRGVLLKGGAPITAPEGATNQVVFIAVDVKGDSDKSVGTGEPFAAILNQDDGSFEVPGPEGRGLPPGKYRVSVTQKYRNKHAIDRPKKRGAAAIDRDTDLLADRFGPTRSPLVVEVLTPETLNLDLERQPAPAAR